MAGHPCFFTIRAYGDRAPFAQAIFADIAVKCLLGQRSKSQCQVEGYCVMPDHIHAVIMPMVDGASSLGFIDRFKGWCAFEMHRAGWKGPLWQPRSHDHLLRTTESTANAIVYMLDNPVRKGLVENPEDYLWSGIPDPIDQTP